MRLITRDDITETIIKAYQRGVRYIISKLSYSNSNRTKSTFNNALVEASNYWIIPRLRQRWNKIISGKEDITYEQYVYNSYLKNKKNLRLLSLGSGVCSHEIVFAQFPNFAKVKCVDFSDKLLIQAKQKANSFGLHNMEFEVTDVNQIKLREDYFDVILFHASLHHFKSIETLIKKTKNCLKDDGILIINEYVGPNRICISKSQRAEINRILTHEIPKSHKTRYKTNWLKKHVSGPGWLRMVLTDPSEAIESEMILPEIHKNFKVKEEKALGGNICMLLFKDIAHHFCGDDITTNKLLDKVFEYEDSYLKKNQSDFVFGVYQSK